MENKLNCDELALLLRSALWQLMQISDNEYGGEKNSAYSIKETIVRLDKDYPLFTKREKAFIRVVSIATGLCGIEKYVVAMRETDGEYTKLENGCTFNDHDNTFAEAYQLGLDRAFEEISGETL